MILAFYDIKPAITGDLLVDIVRPDFSCVEMSMKRNFETLDQIKLRISAAKNNPIPELSSINNACFALLKSGFERLNLGVCEVEIIMKVAQTIARMDNKTEIRVEHIAEAIQYRAINTEDKNVKRY
jgi:predicted ATPase with chaperone activity